MPSSPLLQGSGVLKLSISSEGKPLPTAVQVMSVEIHHAINRIASATIIVIDGDMPSGKFPLSDGTLFKLGAKIVIKAGYGDDETPVFSGLVIKHAVKVDGNNYARLELECRDPALAMTVGRKSASFVKMSDRAIIGKLVAGYAGLSAKVDATDVTHPELVQFYVTDWDFLLARAEANGLLVMTDGGDISVKAPATTAEPVLSLTYGSDLMEFEAELDARWQVDSVVSSSWDMATQKVVQKHAAPLSLTGQGDLDGKKMAAVLGTGPFALQTIATQGSGDLSAWAKAQQLKVALARIRGRMLFQGNAKAKPGVLLLLKNVGDHFNGKVLATSVIQRIVDGNWLTEVEFGMAPSWFAEQHQLAAPPAAGLTAGMEGLQIGVVKKIDADPENQFRVQVTLPLMPAQTEGVWARLAGFYASADCGAFFIPEVGDEVVLGCFNHDPSCPVILGSLYSGKKKPPQVATADNFIKALVTRSKLTLEFNDDKKIITLNTPGKNQVVISDDGKSILLQDQTGNKIELSEKGISLDSAKDIMISAKGKVSITADNNIETEAKKDIKCDAANITLNAKTGLSAKGGATAKLTGGTQVTVKAPMVKIN